MRERKKLKLDNWPFEKGKKTKLIWIGEPFKLNNKWMLDTYFNDGASTERIIQDWANLYFLSIDKYYTDGDLNSGEIIDDEGGMQTIEIDLSGITPKYNETEWYILKSKYRSKSKTFSFWKHNVLYTIPIIEIVRAVLAPNTFMLNAILYNDAWEDYFTYELEDRKLKIDFTNQYKRSYLKNEYYNHLAWIISNEEILKMCDDIGFNMFSKGKLYFDFNMSNLSITARVKKNKYGFTIIEILKVNQKEINIDELKAYHPSFEERKKSNEAKLRTYTYLNNKSEDRTIDSGIDGAKDYGERINNRLIIQEYINIPIVKKEKEGSQNLRTKEDNNTKKYILDDDNLRTLSSEGGVKKASGIETSALDETIIPVELNEFVYNLRELEKLDWIEKVDMRIVMLPLGRKFSYLSNGIDRRKCLIIEILKTNGDAFGIIEVQREVKLISTLILSLTSRKKFKVIFRELLNGLVQESGKWSNKILANLEKENIMIYRKNHSKNYLYNIMSCIK
ncbi:Tn7-like element transposition protein TnsE [Candidatus Clostridium helianthi]|uniref:Tn7-like element transposition protein TnsE n=1 Tax=Candidatus Clostridium helianthi TaxID=3381660 RepID=A0ABW8S403_9CLOT